jgi:hypothetical protein
VCAWARSRRRHRMGARLLFLSRAFFLLFVLLNSWRAAAAAAASASVLRAPVHAERLLFLLLAFFLLFVLVYSWRAAAAASVSASVLRAPEQVEHAQQEYRGAVEGRLLLVLARRWSGGLLTQVSGRGEEEEEEH